jgi:hypothetical protein
MWTAVSCDVTANFLVGISNISEDPDASIFRGEQAAHENEGSSIGNLIK